MHSRGVIDAAEGVRRPILCSQAGSSQARRAEIRPAGAARQAARAQLRAVPPGDLQRVTPCATSVRLACGNGPYGTRQSVRAGACASYFCRFLVVLAGCSTIASGPGKKSPS